MDTEETRVDMKDAEPPAAADAHEPAQAAADADAAEADVSEDLEQEKEGGGEEGGSEEKNGVTKLKMLEEEQEEVKFTGLNKEELLRVAGTPGWVRTRWALLVVFWICWLGMLGGAVLILLQVPGCKELPATRWWNSGLLYQVSRNRVPTDLGYLRGVEQSVEVLSQLKVRGLLVGPVHVAPPDDTMGLRLEEVSPEAGTLDQFRGLVRAAHRRGLSVVLDLTPNYLGASGPWYFLSSVTSVAERLKSALVFWLDEGVDGVLLSGVEHVARQVPPLWADIRAIIQNGTDPHPNRRVLMGVTRSSSAENVSSILSWTGVDLLLSDLVSITSLLVDPLKAAGDVQYLYSSHSQTRLAWTMGPWSRDLLLEDKSLMKALQLLLMTLPGTPVFRDGTAMLDLLKLQKTSETERNGTSKDGQMSHYDFFRTLSELRAQERSLLYGDFTVLHNSSSSLAYLRVWDQSDRYLVALNLRNKEAELQLGYPGLPCRAPVLLNTSGAAGPRRSVVDPLDLHLGPSQAVLLRFPYGG